MEETRDFQLLLHSLAERRGSFVTKDNVNEFSYERTYKNPIDKRPIHVFVHASNGSSVHLEDDSTLYTSFGPTQTVEETPRERGELTDSLRQIIQVRGGDEGHIEALDGQPQPTQEFMSSTVESTTEPDFDIDQVMETEPEFTPEPAPTTQQTNEPPAPATATP